MKKIVSLLLMVSCCIIFCSSVWAENGEYYGFAAGEIGIDVSSHQGEIDWERVAQEGIRFVFVRGNTWDKENWDYIIDSRFEENVREAYEHGIKVGVYLYSYAINFEEAKREIDFFFDSPEMKRLQEDSIPFDLPVFIDVEHSVLIEKIPDNTVRTDLLEYSMELIKNKGYETGFYTYEAFASSYLDMKRLIDDGYDFWIANYNGGYEENYIPQIWQYTGKGKVSGIDTDVDLNIVL